MSKFFATCPKGLESLLYTEINGLEPKDCHETVAGVSFSGDFNLGLKVCLNSRFASKVVMILNTFHCEDDTDLYLGANGIAWEDYFTSNETIAVEFQGTNDFLRNTQYSALKVKDAICDRLLKIEGKRPDVDRKNAQVRVYGLLTSKKEVILALDLSGTPLFLRESYRKVGAAPLKENLAAAMITRAGFKQGNFLDPMCGSGTLLIEAASIATSKAPGLSHEGFGFLKLKQFNQDEYEQLRQELDEKAKLGLEEFKAQGFKIIGFDHDEEAVAKARENVEKAGFSSIVEVIHCPLNKLYNPFENQSAFIVTNPPYGERMGNFNELIALYSALGSKVKENFSDSTLAVISSSQDLLSCLRLTYAKAYKLYNGPLVCQLRVFKIDKAGVLNEEIAPDFANRLRKNLKTIKKWAQPLGLEAYRVYDADLPDYNAAIDFYGPYCVIQEYQAPSTVEEYVSRRRLLDLIAATIEVTGIDGRNIILKQRERQKGKAQYEKLSEEESLHRTLAVSEGDAHFLVNVDDYLDTGLFLDARPIRKLIFDKAKGKSFLNLFSYTATASVMAALGGATRTVSVDMSRTYLDWAMENFKLNGLSLKAHDFIQADCLSYLSQDKGEKFDLIYIDPPTFSNSKRMEKSFEVKRDHVLMLANLTRHLNAGGEIIFCTNKRGFKLDKDSLALYGLEAQDITQETIPFDFKRSKDIHRCFSLSFDPSRVQKEIEPLVTVTSNPKWSGTLKHNKDGFSFKVREGKKSFNYKKEFEAFNPWGRSDKSSNSQTQKDNEEKMLPPGVKLGTIGRPKGEVRQKTRLGNEKSQGFVKRSEERRSFKERSDDRFEKRSFKQDRDSKPTKIRVWGETGLKEFDK